MTWSIPGAMHVLLYTSELGTYVIVTIELLKSHRQDFLYRQQDLLEIPFSIEALHERFNAQAACSSVTQ